MANNRKYYDNDEDDDDSVDSFVSDDLSHDDDPDSSNENDSRTNGDTLGSRESSSKDHLKLASAETQFVLCSKYSAYLVLFLWAVAAGFTAYYLTRNQETSDFETDVSTRLASRRYGSSATVKDEEDLLKVFD